MSIEIPEFFSALESKMFFGEKTKASRFLARLKFARHLSAIEVQSLSVASKDSYFTLLKLGLAYSAVEACEGLIGEGRRVKIVDTDFSAALRAGELDALLRHLKLEAMKALEKRATRGNMPKVAPLAAFDSLPFPEDLAEIVRHSRNLVFHASITPSTIGLQGSNKRRELLLGLAESSLLAAEREFESWMERVARR